MMENAREFEYDYEVVNNRIKPIADRLVSKNSELCHIKTDMVLFIVNHKSKGSRDRVILARTSRISPKWRELLFQFGTNSYSHCIEFFGKTTVCFDMNQMIALVYRELLLIDHDGGIRHPDTNDWWRIIVGLGRHWFYPDSSCPNLLDEDVDWERLLGEEIEKARPLS